MSGWARWEGLCTSVSAGPRRALAERRRDAHANTSNANAFDLVYLLPKHS